MSLDLADVKTTKHVQWNDIQDTLSPSTAIYRFFLMKQYIIRINPYV